MVISGIIVLRQSADAAPDDHNPLPLDRRLSIVITSGVVMNWAMWGFFSIVGSYFFLAIAGGKRK